jgi:hypothetical protein
MAESRARAAAVAEPPVSRIAGAAIIVVWIACLALIAALLFDDFI